MNFVGVIHRKNLLGFRVPLQELGELVPRYMQGPNREALEDARRLKDLRSKASKVLGKGHWTYFLATFAWLQKCLSKNSARKYII